MLVNIEKIKNTVMHMVFELPSLITYSIIQDAVAKRSPCRELGKQVSALAHEDRHNQYWGYVLSASVLRHVS
jgi:hypothetical protein